MAVRSKLAAICLTVWLTTMVLLGCQPSAKAPQQPAALPVLQHLAEGEVPAFNDDLDLPSLQQAIQRSLTFYDHLPLDETLPFGDRLVSIGVLRDSLRHFSKILETSPKKLEDSTFIAREFDVYRTAGGRTGSLLVTGYYEPILPGGLKPTAKYRYPIYRVPPDLVAVELSQFGLKHCAERLVGRLEGNRVVPYFTRAEIVGQGRLERYQGQLAWLDDPISVFFLHIQGSGVIRLDDGQVLRVGYAGSNGRPYRSVGKYLLDRGVIAPEEMSLQAIREYLQQHLEQLDEVLNYNESFVFFRRVTEGPLGNMGYIITAGRSIATDQRNYPKGALGFLVSEKPQLDPSGRRSGWEPLQRWVLNQDTGGAIRGPRRIDLFFGTGHLAEAMAGPMKQPGIMYFLLKKGSVLVTKAGEVD